MTGADWGLLAAVFVLFLASAVLALAETAFTKVSRIRAIAMQEEGRRNASKLVRMLEEPARTLNSVLLGVLVCQFTAATLVGVIVERLGPLAVLAAPSWKSCCSSSSRRSRPRPTRSSTPSAPRCG